MRLERIEKNIPCGPSLMDHTVGYLKMLISISDFLDEKFPAIFSGFTDLLIFLSQGPLVVEVKKQNGI